MKIFRYSVLAFLFITLISCSGEDDNPTVESSNLTGEWNLEDMNYTGTSTVNFGGTAMTTSYTGELTEADAQVVFSDGNKWASSGSYVVKLTTNMDGMTDVQNVPVSNFSGQGTYSINGNKLTTTQDNFEMSDSYEMLPMQFNEATISELTENRMVLTFNYSITTTVMEDMEVEINMEGFQILTR